MPPGTYGEIWVSDGGAPYKARARYRDFDGVVRTVARFGQTKTAAKNALVAALRDRARAAQGSHITPATTIADLAGLWLAAGVKTSGQPWATNTRETYAYIVANEVIPALGGIRIGELKLSVVNRALSTIAARNGPGAAKTMKTALSGMCQLAIQHEALEANPVRDAIRITKQRKGPVRALTPGEVEDLTDRLRADRDAVRYDLPDLVDWMLGTGARIGETCAARDAVLDLQAGTWEINATTIRIKGRKPGLVVQERPKTAAGWRILALPPYCVQIAERRATEIRLRADEAVLFPAPKAPTLRDPSNTAKGLRQALDRLGYDWVTSHTFRKTVATRLDEAGQPARVIADQLGHAKPSMTQDVYMGRAVVSADAARILDR
jgi:integrase